MVTDEQTRKVLEQLREDVIGALTRLEVEIAALRLGVLEEHTTLAERLGDHQKTANLHQAKVRASFERAIRPVA